MREIGELDTLELDEPALAVAFDMLACERLPAGRTYQQWLDHLAERFTAHLDATGYQPPDGLDPAYPAHDIRARRT